MKMNANEAQPGMSRDQLPTIGDLNRFKKELLEELSAIISKGAINAQQANKWLKTHEVRKLLNISSGKLLTLRINGTLPYTKIGGVVYYCEDDIQQMFQSKKFQHAQDEKK